MYGFCFTVTLFSTLTLYILKFPRKITYLPLFHSLILYEQSIFLSLRFIANLLNLLFFRLEIFLYLKKYFKKTFRKDT